MYCTHCGKEIDESKIEASASSVELAAGKFNHDTKIDYVCPRCGHIVHHGLTEADTKELSRAAHAEIQRGHNSFASGMGNSCIGVILLAIAIIFFRLSKKATNNFKLATDCVEFYVFCVLLVISVALLAVGITFVVQGIYRQKKYYSLLRDIQNQTFVQ